MTRSPLGWQEAAEMAGGILFMLFIIGTVSFMVIGAIVITGGWALLIPVVFGIMVLLFKFTPLGAWLDRVI